MELTVRIDIRGLWIAYRGLDYGPLDPAEFTRRVEQARLAFNKDGKGRQETFRLT